MFVSGITSQSLPSQICPWAKVFPTKESSHFILIYYYYSYHSALLAPPPMPVTKMTKWHLSLHHIHYNHCDIKKKYFKLWTSWVKVLLLGRNVATGGAAKIITGVFDQLVLFFVFVFLSFDCFELFLPIIFCCCLCFLFLAFYLLVERFVIMWPLQRL